MQPSTTPVCPRCQKPLPLADAAFCPHCGAPVKAASAAPVPEGAQALLAQAEAQRDPRKKHDILGKAQAEYPDCLAVAQAILFLGRLHERNPRNPDFSVIKCYLLHLYLTPDDFTPETRAQMRTELFHHPDLERCLALAPDKQVFLRQYLERMAQDFIQLFLKGSSRYAPTFFGFRMERSVAKQLSNPVAHMLQNMAADGELDAPERDMLYQATYDAYAREMAGDTHWLDALLKKQHLPQNP